MRWIKSLYDVELTYRDQGCSINPSEYQNVFFNVTQSELDHIRAIYKLYAELHVKALFESIRRHSRTKKGKGWQGEMRAVISCQKGYIGLDTLRVIAQQYPSLSKPINHFLKVCDRPDRLHIHLLVYGEPGRTIVEGIQKYWSRRHGFVKKKKITEADLTGWYNEYVQSQKLSERKCNFG